MILAKRLAWEKRLRNADISRATGLDQATVSKLFNGRMSPYPVQAKKIALALGFDGDVEELFSEVYDG